MNTYTTAFQSAREAIDAIFDFESKTDKDYGYEVNFAYYEKDGSPVFSVRVKTLDGRVFCWL